MARLEEVEPVERPVPTAAARLDELQTALVSVSRYLRSLENLVGGEDDVLRGWHSTLVRRMSEVAELQASEKPVTYAEVLAVLRRLGSFARFVDKQTKGQLVVRALPVAPVPYVAMATGEIVGTLTPHEIEAVLAEIKAAIDELWESMSPEDRKKALEYILDVYAAIEAIRKTGLTPETLRELGASMRALFELLKFLGGGVYESPLFQRLLSFVLRFAQSLAGDGASAAGGFVLVDLLVTLVILILWGLLWVKIGSWFWNRPIGGSSKTYVDFWSDRFYDFYRSLKNHSCEDMLEEWIQADRDVRQKEAAGAGLGQLTVAAIHAWALAKTLLERCPDISIKPVLRSRSAHYDAIVARFDQLVAPSHP
jgi:hypothetical protein